MRYFENHFPSLNKTAGPIKAELNKLAKLRRCMSRVQFAAVHFETRAAKNTYWKNTLWKLKSEMPCIFFDPSNE